MKITSKINHNPVYFNHNPAQQVSSQKHLGMYLDTELNFQEHLNNVEMKINKTIGLLHNLQAFLPRQSLIKVCEASITTGMLFSTKLIMTPSIKKWSQYIITLQ